MRLSPARLPRNCSDKIFSTLPFSRCSSVSPTQTIGRNATPQQAQEAHAFIRDTLAKLSDATTAGRIRIQYGGSVKVDNARAIMSQPDIDGALVGGASLDARSFAQIVQAADEDKDAEAGGAGPG